MIFSTNSPKWQIVHKTEDVMQAEMLKMELLNNEIQCFIVNKKDTMYPIFGASLLYVDKDRAEVAKVIIDTFLNQNETEVE